MFERLRTQNNFMPADDDRRNRPRRYVAIGGDEVFEFQRNGRQATIQFICGPRAAPSCRPGPKVRLVGEPSGRGDLLFKTERGVAVLRWRAAGGATLYPGASFVPDTVPEGGRAVEPARRR